MDIVTRICEKVSRAIKKTLPDDYLGITTRARRLVVSRAIKKAYTLTEISKLRNRGLTEQGSRLLTNVNIQNSFRRSLRAREKNEFFESIRAGDIDTEQQLNKAMEYTSSNLSLF